MLLVDFWKFFFWLGFSCWLYCILKKKKKSFFFFNAGPTAVWYSWWRPIHSSSLLVFTSVALQLFRPEWAVQLIGVQPHHYRTLCGRSKQRCMINRASLSRYHSPLIGYCLPRFMLVQFIYFLIEWCFFLFFFFFNCCLKILSIFLIVFSVWVSKFTWNERLQNIGVVVKIASTVS